MFKKQDARGVLDFIKKNAYPSPLCSLVCLLNLSGRPDSRDLMRKGVEVLGIGGSSVEDPVP